MFKMLLFFICIIAINPLSSYTDEHPFKDPALLKILELTGINHDETRPTIIQKTQEIWLQKGKERWEFEEIFTEHQDEIFFSLKSLGLIDTISSPSKNFDYAAVHGALFSRVCKRLSFLIDEWNKGVRFHTLVFLTGDRDLITEKESIEIFESYFPNKEIPTIPQNEGEMVEMVYQLMDLPKEMRDLDAQFIHAPKVNGKRPNTKDTIQEWLKMNLRPGSVLFISNQPYVNYQHAIAKTYMPSSFSLITIGQKVLDTPLSIHLDNLAKWLYQEDVYFKKLILTYEQKIDHF